MHPNPTLEALAREAEQCASKITFADKNFLLNSDFQKAVDLILRALTRATEPLEQKILTLSQLNIDACAFEDELIKKLNVPARIDDQDEVDSTRILKAVERLQADCVVMREALKGFRSCSCPSHWAAMPTGRDNPHSPDCVIGKALRAPHPGQHLLDELLRLRVTANERDSLLVENATLREQLTEALKEVPTADTAIWTKMFRKP